jgi:hypothetical protein
LVSDESPIHAPTEPETVEAPPEPRTKPSEPIVREHFRGWIAVGLVALFVVEVLGGGVFLLWGGPPYAERVQALKDFAVIFVGPTAALAGSVTAFYFSRPSG